MNVLIIDDNQEITDMVSFFLESQNISCTVANNGRDGLNKIKDERFDVILLDLTMPGFSGHDLFYYLKRKDLLKQNNVLIFTSLYFDDGDIQKMITDGARGIIRKPISIDKIIEAIERFR
jgi:CheY-like chemotaxis protein